MSFADKKGISVASGFKLQAQAPIDARFQVKTIQERDELVSIKAAYPGLTVYVTDTKTMYVYNGSGWDEMAKGAGYTHPTTPGYKHIPAGGAAGQILKWKADGEAQWAAENVTDSRVVRHADVPAPLIFLGGGIKPETIRVPVNITRIAPTLSSAMRIRAPNACTATPLNF